MTRQDLTDDLADLLDYPHMKGHGKAYKLVGVILDTIVNGLLKDGRVAIDGLGIWEIYERPGTRHGVYWYPHLRPKGEPCDVVEFPPTKRVIFKPSKSILRSLNG